MVFAAYLLENSILMLSQGGAIVEPHRGVFVLTARPHREAFAASVFQNKIANARGWGEWHAWN